MIVQLHEKRCFQTGKVAFRLRGDAIMAMLETLEKRGEDPIRSRSSVYRCEKCGWHHWGNRGYPTSRSIHEP